MDNPQKRPGDESLQDTKTNGEERGSESWETKSPETNTQQDAVNTPAEGSDTKTSEALNSKLVFAIVIAVLAALLIGAYLFTTKKDSAPGIGAENSAASQSEDLVELLDLEKTDVVARVNGEELEWKDYERSLNEILQSAASSGVDVSDPAVQKQIKSQALTALVNTKLLFQASKEAGIEADSGVVESEFENIEGQIGGSEALAQMLEDFELTSEDLRASIAEQLAINEFINETVNPGDINVSAEEVEAVYNQASGGAQNGELPPLEEVRGAIESQIQSQKQQELVAELIERLREEAEIELLV